MLSVVTELEELENLRGEWSQLWREDPRATPFQSPEWLLPWCRHLFGGGQFWTVIQRREGRLVSLLPLFRYGAHREHLAFIGTGITDYLDLIGEPIEAIPGDWTDASLEEIRPGSPLADFGRPQPCSVCPVTKLPATMKELLQRIDPKLAVDVHRSNNRLQRAGSVTIERTNSLRDLFALHQARWESKSEQGMLAELRLQAFHHAVAAGFERLGILRLYHLLLNGTAAAVIYAFTHRQRGYAYLSGFDPALSKLSPGTALLAHVMGEAMREGVEEFDFLRQPDAYKYRWDARDQPTWQLKIVKPAPGRSSPDRYSTR